MAREKTYDDILASFVPKVRLSFENLFSFHGYKVFVGLVPKPSAETPAEEILDPFICHAPVNKLKWYLIFRGIASSKGVVHRCSPIILCTCFVTRYLGVLRSVRPKGRIYFRAVKSSLCANVID